MKEQLKTKLETGTIDDIKDVYYKHFHEIKHTECFGILINRLEKVIKAFEELEEWVNAYNNILRTNIAINYDRWGAIRRVREKIQELKKGVKG